MHALVIEGGGMKAAYANGVLSAFEEADYAPWDAVVGTSAGGALAAWYSAGQARWAESTWAYAADPRILNYRRAALRRGPLLDHEALLEIVYRTEHPLDVDAVRAAPWPVIVTACDVDTGEVVYQDLRSSDVIAWIKATGRLPLASGPPVEIDGRRFIDGGTMDPIPIRWAVEELGATRVTLVMNKPPGPLRSDPKVAVRAAAKRFPALRDGIERHQEIKHDAVRYALRPPPGVQVDVVHPSRPTRVSRLARGQHAIGSALALGRRDGRLYVAAQNETD